MECGQCNTLLSDERPSTVGSNELQIKRDSYQAMGEIKSTEDLVEAETSSNSDKTQGRISETILKNEKPVHARPVSEQAPEAVMMVDDPDKCVNYGPEAQC